ncbi:hypothetical protein GGS24DRAFT_274050 [Hypoxylon argillaceum]|nr:hypothetical protein GGS24DRAFT_274050 [Hypoxylon argillaceum]
MRGGCGHGVVRVVHSALPVVCFAHCPVSSVAAGRERIQVPTPCYTTHVVIVTNLDTVPCAPNRTVSTSQP